MKMCSGGSKGGEAPLGNTAGYSAGYPTWFPGRPGRILSYVSALLTEAKGFIAGQRHIEENPAMRDTWT